MGESTRECMGFIYGLGLPALRAPYLEGQPFISFPLRDLPLPALGTEKRASSLPPLGPRPPRPASLRARLWKLTLLPVCWARALAMELKLALLPKSPCKKTRGGRATSPSKSL